jgi:hypothetical protein
VCLLALKNLVSLQARTTPSFQPELDLCTSADELIEVEKKERNVVFVPLNVLLRRDALQSFFFSRLHREDMCIYTHNRCVSGCVYSTIASSIMYILAND